MNRIVGIDSGTNGAIVSLSLDGDIIDTFLLKDVYNVKNGYNFPKLNEYMRSIADDIKNCGVEKVYGFNGSSKLSAFSMGGGLQFIYDVLSANNIKYINIAAKTWQNYSRMNDDIIFTDKTTKSGKLKIDTKKTAMNVAGRLFPNQTLRATKRSTTAHDGKTDAALIAYYVLKNY